MNKLRRKVELKYIPGDPPVPATPPTCTTTEKRTAVRASSSGSSYTSVPPGGSTAGLVPVIEQGAYNPLTMDYDDVIVGWMPQRQPGGYTSGSSRYETTCTGGSPGKPGTPGRVETVEGGPDWRASARSVASRAGAVVASFEVNSKPRLAVGFGTTDSGPAFSDIAMGVLLKTAGVATEIYPITDGVVGDTPLGYFTPGDRVALVRSHGRFIIKSGSETVYAASATTEDDVFLDAMLYTSDDYVDNPSLADAVSASIRGSVGLSVGLSTQTSVRGAVGLRTGTTGVVDGESLVRVRGAVGFSGDAGLTVGSEVSVSGAVGVAGKLSALGEWAEAVTELPALRMIASDAERAGGSVTLPALSMDATSNVVIEVAGASLSLPSFGFYSRTLTGSVGSVNYEAPALKMLAADSDYAGADLTLPALTMSADDGYNLPGFQFVWENVNMADSIVTDPSLYASIRFGLELQPELTFGILVSDTLLDGLILDPGLSVGDIVYALVNEGLDLSSATQGPTDIWGQYGFDLETGAATRYDNFEFDGFAYSPEATYAYRKDGVYLLREGDDDGAPRHAMVDLGATDFGTNAKKHIETAFVGLSTDGTVYLKLNADGRGDRTYRVIQRDPLMRARVGRGITARQWHAKLEIVDERSSELDGVEFHVAASARRWTK